MASGRPGAISRLLLAGGAVVVSLVAMEIGLRVISPLRRFVNPGRAFHRFDAEVGWRGRPEIDQRFVSGTGDFDVRVQHDREGFRLHRASPAEQGAPVWAVLGDSFTWGWGVDQGEVFTDLLQRELGARATVRNLGINATSTLQQALLLEDLARAGFRSARVVVMMFVNDFAECVQVARDKPYLDVDGDRVVVRNHPVADSHYREGWWRRLVRESALCTTVACAADLWKRRLFEASTLIQVDAPTPVSDSQRVAMRHALGRIRATCESLGAEGVVVLVPLPAELAASRPTPFQSNACALASELGLGCIDLTPALREASHGDWTRLYLKRDGHWTAEGHQVAAATLHGALAR